jgi:hypothetical protein
MYIQLVLFYKAQLFLEVSAILSDFIIENV